MRLKYFILFSAASSALIAFYIKLQQLSAMKYCTIEKCLKGQIVLITGASSGLGKIYFYCKIMMRMMIDQQPTYAFQAASWPMNWRDEVPKLLWDAEVLRGPTRPYSGLINVWRIWSTKRKNMWRTR